MSKKKRPAHKVIVERLKKLADGTAGGLSQGERFQELEDVLAEMIIPEQARKKIIDELAESRTKAAREGLHQVRDPITTIEKLGGKLKKGS